MRRERPIVQDRDAEADDRRDHAVVGARAVSCSDPGFIEG